MNGKNIRYVRSWKNWCGTDALKCTAHSAGNYYWYDIRELSNLHLARILLLTSCRQQGYLPPSADRRGAVLDRKRKEYHSWVQQHYEMDRIDMSDDELAVLHQIKIDIPRTVAKVDLFKIPDIQR